GFSITGAIGAPIKGYVDNYLNDIHVNNLLKQAGFKTGEDDKGIYTIYYDEDGNERHGYVAARMAKEWSVNGGYSDTDVLTALTDKNAQGGIRAFDNGEHTPFVTVTVVPPAPDPNNPAASQQIDSQVPSPEDQWARTAGKVLGYVDDGAVGFAKFAADHPIIAGMAIT